MKQVLLYHVKEHWFHYVPPQQILEDGITHLTKSNNFYSTGGGIEIELTEKLRPSYAPEWIDFKKAIGVRLKKTFSRTFCFPVFTDKIMVFNFDISMFIYDQAFFDDHNYMLVEALGYDTGEEIENHIKRYWDSMMTLDEYLKTTPFEPEILLFEPVPSEIIKVCE